MIETSMKDKVFGIELAKERTIYAIVDIRGNILAKDGFPTTDYDNVNDYVSVLCERLVEMMLANDVFGAIRSVGISAPSCPISLMPVPWVSLSMGLLMA